MKKKLTLVVSLLLVMALSIGGTLAYLTFETQEVKNTFTVGNVKIDLTETGATEENGWTNSYKMIPGDTIAKDPKVTVDQNSEDCWLFVKVEGSENYSKFLEHKMATGWEPLKDVANVFVYTGTITKGTAISVLDGDKVTVKTTVTQEMMDDITDTTKNVDEPTLTITAYACQKANVSTAADAWNALNPA